MSRQRRASSSPSPPRLRQVYNVSPVQGEQALCWVRQPAPRRPASFPRCAPPPTPPSLTRLATPDTRGSGANVHLLSLSLPQSRTLLLRVLFRHRVYIRTSPSRREKVLIFKRWLEMVLSGVLFWLERKFNSISPLPNFAVRRRGGGMDRFLFH